MSRTADSSVLHILPRTPALRVCALPPVRIVRSARPDGRATGHTLWSGPWPTIWIGAAVLLALMGLAQLVLRLDVAL